MYSYKICAALQNLLKLHFTFNLNKIKLNQIKLLVISLFL